MLKRSVDENIAEPINCYRVLSMLGCVEKEMGEASMIVMQ